MLLLYDAVMCAGVHLEIIPLLRQRAGSLAQSLREMQDGPSCYGHAVPHFLSHDFVRWNVEVFAHCVVEPHQTDRDQLPAVEGDLPGGPPSLVTQALCPRVSP